MKCPHCGNSDPTLMEALANVGINKGSPTGASATIYLCHVCAKDFMEIDKK